MGLLTMSRRTGSSQSVIHWGPSSSVSHQFTIRVPDCKAAYEILKERGAEFLTPPHDWGQEIRCFFRHYDEHLLEISEVSVQVKSMLFYLQEFY